MREQGTIIKWFDDRGYGFIKPDDVSAEDVFLHQRQIVTGIPREGATVDYSVAARGQRNRPTADDAKVL